MHRWFFCHDPAPPAPPALGDAARAGADPRPGGDRVREGARPAPAGVPRRPVRAVRRPPRLGGDGPRHTHARPRGARHRPAPRRGAGRPVPGAARRARPRGDLADRWPLDADRAGRPRVQGGDPPAAGRAAPARGRRGLGGSGPGSRRSRSRTDRRSTSGSTSTSPSSRTTPGSPGPGGRWPTAAPISSAPTPTATSPPCSRTCSASTPSRTAHYHVVYRDAESNRRNLLARPRAPLGSRGSRRSASPRRTGAGTPGSTRSWRRWAIRIPLTSSSATTTCRSSPGATIGSRRCSRSRSTRSARGCSSRPGSTTAASIADYLAGVVRAKVRAGEPAFVYGHPERRLGRFPEVLSALSVAIAGDALLWRVTLTEFARWWRWRGGRRWSVVPKAEGRLEVQFDDWDETFPLGLEVVRGPHVSTVPVTGPRMMLRLEDMAYERRDVRPHLPAPVPAPRSPSLKLKAAVRQALDWETVTPLHDLPANTLLRARQERIAVVATHPTHGGCSMIETLLPSPIIDPPLWLDARSHGKMTPARCSSMRRRMCSSRPAAARTSSCRRASTWSRGASTSTCSLPGPTAWSGRGCSTCSGCRMKAWSWPEWRAPGDPRGPFADLLVRAEGDRRAGD